MDQQQTTKKVSTPKVLDSSYFVKVNGEVTSNGVGTLKEARDIVRGLNTNGVTKVEIVRRNTTETLINTFEPKATVALVSVDDLTLGE